VRLELPGTSTLIYYLRVGKKGCPSGATYKNQINDKLPNLLVNIRLGWKWLAVANTPTYNPGVMITAVNYFIKQENNLKLLHNLNILKFFRLTRI
jgi:hypothetical protein